MNDKLNKIIWGRIVLVGCFLCGCTSSENEPQDPPVDPETPVVENLGVGLSKTGAFVGGWYSYINDTVEVATDDWTITTVSFCDAKYFEVPYHYPKTSYITDLSGRAPFDETISWLRLQYKDGQIVLSDVDPFYVAEWPEYRYAFVEFERDGEITDTLLCKDESEMPAGLNGIGPNPDRVVFPAQGGTVNLRTQVVGWVFYWLEVAGVRHEFSKDDGTQDFKEFWTNTDFAYTMEWVTIERYKFGNADEITVTVTPNETGQEREFSFGIGPWAVWGVFEGVQTAD